MATGRLWNIYIVYYTYKRDNVFPEYVGFLSFILFRSSRELSSEQYVFFESVFNECLDRYRICENIVMMNSV